MRLLILQRRLNTLQNTAHDRYAAIALNLGTKKFETLRYQLTADIVNTSGADNLTISAIDFDQQWSIAVDSTSSVSLLTVSTQWRDSTGPHVITLSMRADITIPDTTRFTTP